MEHLALAQRTPEAADEAHFSGRATLTRFLGSAPGAPGRVYRVRFEAGSRTHWHTHTGVQLLCVIEGSCRVQAWGREVITARPGDVVRVEPDEKHWHGASDDGPMTHLAVNLGERTEWLEAVADNT